MYMYYNHVPADEFSVSQVSRGECEKSSSTWRKKSPARASKTKTEDVLGQKWDHCMADALIKTGMSSLDDRL